MIDTVHAVQTPEGVDLALRVAGPVPRALAWGVDTLLQGGIALALQIAFAGFAGLGTGLYLIGLFALLWFYPVLFEVRAHGQTPGKRLMGLRVLQENGTPVGWSASVLRNFLLVADFLPALYLAGLVSMLADASFRRLGDLAAGTLVVHAETPRARLSPIPEVTPVAPDFPARTRRAGGRDRVRGARRQPLGRARGGARRDSPLARRRLRSASAADLARRVPGRAQGVTLEVFEARGRARWDRLAGLLAELERGETRGAAELPPLYRQLCHDLALARERQVSGTLVAELNDLALAGHRLLYQARTGEVRGIGRFLSIDFPRAVRLEWRLVAGLHALFYGLALLLGLLAWQNPDLIYSFISPESVSEIEAMYDAAGAGEGPTRTAGSDATMFGFYIWNNVSIAFPAPSRAASRSASARS